MITQTLVVSLFDWNTVSVADTIEKTLMYTNSDSFKMEKTSKEGVPKGLFFKEEKSSCFHTYQICLSDYT